MRSTSPGVLVAIGGPPRTDLGLLLIEALRARGIETHLVMTEDAHGTAAALADHRYSISNQAARISSGSFPTRGMVVVPCDLGTLDAISLGLSRNLLERAADVTIKERRPLVLLVAEPARLRYQDMARRFEGTTTDIIPLEGDSGLAIQRALGALLGAGTERSS